MDQGLLYNMIWFIVQAPGHNTIECTVPIIVNITIRLCCSTHPELTTFSSIAWGLLRTLKARPWTKEIRLSRENWSPQPTNLVCAWCRCHSFGHILLKEQDQENPEEFISSHGSDQLGQDGQAPVLWHVGQGIHKDTNDLDHHLLHASRGLWQVTVFSLGTQRAGETGYCRWVQSLSGNFRKQEKALRAR